MVMNAAAAGWRVWTLGLHVPDPALLRAREFAVVLCEGDRVLGETA
jgi:hypothetical protein